VLTLQLLGPHYPGEADRISIIRTTFQVTALGPCTELKKNLSFGLKKNLSFAGNQVEEHHLRNIVFVAN
jgi:hypothetical protein